MFIREKGTCLLGGQGGFYTESREILEQDGVGVEMLMESLTLCWTVMELRLESGVWGHSGGEWWVQHGAMVEGAAWHHGGGEGVMGSRQE